MRPAGDGAALAQAIMKDALVLRLPREDEEQEFLRAHKATTPGDPNFLHYYQEGMPLARYLEVLAEHARGRIFRRITFRRLSCLRLRRRELSGECLSATN